MRGPAFHRPLVAAGLRTLVAGVCLVLAGAAAGCAEPEFPPSHLAEHMAMGDAVRVSFREDGPDLVVYRVEDAPEP